MTEKLPTLILRAFSFLSVLAVLLICIFGLPTFGREFAATFPDYAFGRYPILAGLYTAALCFFFGIYHFWRLLGEIDKGDGLSVKRLQPIRYSAMLIAVLYFLSLMPAIFLFAQADDAPGAIIIGAFPGTFPIAAAAVIAVLERLVRNGRL
ncbi:MAG: DUF2975 domain-containing protein [Gemmatimonadota bacterium]|jgi:hypothetical protein|nr:DUF2975 domain-containing protein [Gemmatimonadota bacterium]